MFLRQALGALMTFPVQIDTPVRFPEEVWGTPKLHSVRMFIWDPKVFLQLPCKTNVDKAMPGDGQHGLETPVVATKDKTVATTAVKSVDAPLSATYWGPWCPSWVDVTPKYCCLVHKRPIIKGSISAAASILLSVSIPEQGCLITRLLDTDLLVYGRYQAAIANKILNKGA